MSDTANALAAMSTASKRVRVHNAQMVTKLPETVKALVSEVARTRGVSDADIVREALSEYFTRRGYAR
jgi:hypothetical protein